MAGLAVPAIEGLAEWLVPRLVILFGGAVLADQVARKKDDTKEQAPAIPDTATRTRTRNCTQCPPDCGSLVTRNWNMSAVSQAYQARVTGFAPGTEWNFAGNDFDGFRSGMCRLEEAKAKYDQFFDSDTGDPKAWWRNSGGEGLILQARTQNAIVIANPPTTLCWYFMEQMTYSWCASQFGRARLSIVAVHQP